MNINEIQSTLDTLRIRHPSLDEGTLKLLLSSGGWDETSIREAVALFNHGDKTDSKVATTDVIGKIENLPEIIDSSHLLEEHYEDKKIEIKPKESEDIKSVPVVVEPIIEKVVEEKIKEPESLIVPIKENYFKKEVELPDNLPLRPFESAPHVWPFSKYKDVFYGEVMPTLSQEEHIEAEKNKIEKIRLDPVPLTKKDESLILLASTMLLVILMLLGYMYSNGRL